MTIHACMYLRYGCLREYAEIPGPDPTQIVTQIKWIQHFKLVEMEETKMILHSLFHRVIDYKINMFNLSQNHEYILILSLPHTSIDHILQICALLCFFGEREWLKACHLRLLRQAKPGMPFWVCCPLWIPFLEFYCIVSFILWERIWKTRKQRNKNLI